MAITPKDALLQAQEALALNWTLHQEIEAVTGVVEKLVSELSSAELLLRTVQVLWLPDGAKDRASAKRVLTSLKEVSVVLAQGPSVLGWARVVAWAALRVGVEKDRKVAAVVSLMRSATEWTSMPSRYRELVHELISVARDANSRVQTSAPRAFVGFAPLASDASLAEAMARPESTATMAEWSDSDDDATLHAALLSLQLHEEILTGAVQQIEAHLAQPPSVAKALSEPLEFLWWGQSLYSPHLDQSYRDLPLNQRLFSMSEDMAALGDVWPSEQRVAYFTETLRRVGLDLDVSQPLREHASELIAACNLDRRGDGTPEALAGAIDADPTGLPTAFLAMGIRKGITQELLLAGLNSRVDLDLGQEIPRRQWAAWVCRERLLLRFLHTMVR